MNNALPDIKVKVAVDDSQLKAVGKAGGAVGAQLEAGMGKGTASLGKFSSALSGVMSMTGLGGLPQTALRGEQALEGMTATGVSGMTLLGGAALAGTGLLVAGIEHSISSYGALAGQVENYKRVTGSSAEESGRMVQTFETLGVSEDTATAGMFKLSKAIETTPKKLTDLGVTIAHNAAGNVDLSKTLFNVADAYNATLDPAKKNLILFDAFGKSGKDMIPILEQGSAKLRQMEDAAHITFSEEDLQRAKDYQIRLAQLKQGWDSIWESVGQKVVPVLDDAMTRMDRTAYITKKLKEALDSGTLSWGDFQKASLGSETAGNGIVKTLGAQYDASHKVKSALDEQSKAEQELTAHNEELWTSADKLITQQEAQANAGFALQLADLAVTESQGKVTQARDRAATSIDAVTAAQDKLDAVNKQFGVGSEEANVAWNKLQSAQAAAAQATDDITRAEIEQKKEFLAVGAAARKMQEDTDLLSGTSKNVSLDIEAEVAALQKEADALAPSSPLRTFLEGYIATLESRIPRDITTRFTTEYMTTGHGLRAFAEGGRPPVGPIFRVGEKGPELMQLDQPATVYPTGTGPPAQGLGQGDIIVNGPLVHAPTDADPYRVAAEVGYEVQLLRRTR